MIETITNYLTMLAAYTLLMSGLIIIFKAPPTRSKPAMVFFIICVLLYLIIEFVPDGILFYVFIAGPFLIPFSFWFFSRSLFSDSPQHRGQILVSGVGILSIYYFLLYLSGSETCQCAQFTGLLSRGISLLFIVLAIFEAQKGKTVDLVDKRKKLRSLFTYAVSIIVLLTLMAELGLQSSDQQIPQLVQRASILIFTSYFLIRNISWSDSFLGSIVKKIEIGDPQLPDRIQSKMLDEGLYRKEGLTIGKLAEELHEQEYKVRQTINQQMGYRNFTDFVNSFRIQEAKKLLSDPEKKKVTVLEVAYQVGFNSISPFNRAFKLVTGVTPTEYRRDCYLDR